MKARFEVITLFPEMIAGLFREGVVGQAAQKGLIALEILNPRKFATGVHQGVDDRPFGGGDGMVMSAEIMQQALDEAKAHDPAAEVYYLSPQGETLTDAWVRERAKHPHLILICGRYGGIDQRFLVKNKIKEISIGDYVLSGGELAAGVVIDAVARQIPGVLGHAESPDAESFGNGRLEAPQYTRPRDWEGMSVPEALLSGNHARIQEWRDFVGRLVTFQKRPDLKPFAGLNEKAKARFRKFWDELSAQDKKSLGFENLADSWQDELSR